MQRVVKNDFDVSVQNVEEVFNSIDGYYEILGVRLRFAQSHIKLHIFFIFFHFFSIWGFSDQWLIYSHSYKVSLKINTHCENDDARLRNARTAGRQERGREVSEIGI